jgi:hypothetical protein
MARSAFFHRTRNRVSPLLLAGFAASSLLLVGCDNQSGKADKSVTEKLDNASLQMVGPESARTAGAQLLASAAQDSTASLPVRLRAKVLLADSELHAAESAIVAVQSNSATINQLTREIGLLSDNITANNMRAAALAKQDPTAVQNTITQKQTDIKGSDDKPDWYKSGDVSLASLAANDKQAGALQTQVQQLSDAVKSESDQHTQLLDQADKLAEKSNHEPKEISTKDFLQAVDLRKQAADLSVKLDQDNLALSRAQGDLSIRTGQHESLTTSLKNLDDKSAFYAEDWKGVQQRIADLNTGSKSILGETDPVADAISRKDPKTGDLITEGKPGVPNTIGAKAAAIASLAKDNHAQRDLASVHFNNAVSFYKESVDLANKVQQELGDKLVKKTDPSTNADAIAYNEEKKTLDPSIFKTSQATALLERGEMEARLASESKTRSDLLEQLKPVLAAAQLTPPASMDEGTLSKDYKDALEAARKDYGDAVDLLDHIRDGNGTPEQRNAAQIQEIFAHYSWASLEALAGDTQKAADQMTAAKTQVSASVSAGIILPDLPAELAPATPTRPH